MLLIHPVMQILATLLSLYVLYLGLARFRSLHLNMKSVFKRPRHVLLGGLTMAVWLTGLVAAMVLVYVYWQGFLLSAHGKTGLVMALLIVFGLGSGLYMNSRKKKRTILPLAHGVVNLVVVILAILQIFSGYGFYRMYILGN